MQIKTFAQQASTNNALQLNALMLANDLQNVMQQDDILLAIHEHHDATPLIQKLCEQAMQYSELRQQLSVMAELLPSIYQRSLHCTWLAFLIAKEMRLNPQDIAHVFLAALSHDIGLLHLDPEILHRKAALSSSDWAHIQQHVVIGQTLLAAMPAMPEVVAQAVFEHHERCDGTGYPLGKVESELGLLGLIVGLADSVIAIYHNRFKAQGGSWRDAIPIIQMNTQAYFHRNYEVLVAIIRRSEIPVKNVVQGDATPEFVAELMYKNERLKQWFDALCGGLMAVGFMHGDRRLHALQNIMLHVSTAVEGSGIFTVQQQTLLNVLQKKSTQMLVPDIIAQNNSVCDLENTHVMQQEIVFHLQRLERMLQLYLESDVCKNPKIKNALVAGLANSKNFLKQ
jgi:HD-GYP domain-containing protein (c-di-GMP phosphodiesterase class II)